MLGQTANRIEYKTISDFKNASDYLDYMYSGVQGIIYRATINPKYWQGYYRSTGLSKARYAGVENCYVSMNTFFRTSDLDEQQGRDVLHLKRLNALYVDIDCYTLSISKNEVLIRLREDFFESVIPTPTFIIDSGRGIYLIWKLRNEDKRALPRWSAVQNHLIDVLSELGSDQACKDAARVLRVPSSMNVKSGTDVKILEFNDLTYSIYEIAKEYDIKAKNTSKPCSVSQNSKYPYNHATERQRKYVNDIATRLALAGDELPDFADYHATDAWIKQHKDAARTHRDDGFAANRTVNRCFGGSIANHLSRLCSDIRTLFALRKGADCKRELALFLYRYFSREMGYDSDSALNATLALNAAMDCPFDAAYVAKATASADARVQKGIPYAYRKDTIISLLGVTKEELQHLPYLASGKKNAKERRQARNRQAYEKRLAAQGKAAKKDSVLERRAQILTLREQGASAAEIQASLGISRATYHRDIAALTVQSVLDAAKALLATQKENAKEFAKKTVHAVRSAAKSAKNGVVAFFGNAVKRLKNIAKLALSHFFSPLFIAMYSVAVPHGASTKFRRSKRRVLRRKLPTSDGKDDSDGDDH